MKFKNDEVRRQDRLLKEENAKLLLRDSKYGVLSMQDKINGVYAVPISYAWDGEDSIYFHCAKEGRKLTCIANCNKVSFCIVGEEEVIPEKFTTLYESVIIEGVASIGLSDDERMKALLLLVKKYSPKHLEKGKKYAQGSFSETEIIKLEITSSSGKCRK